ncbi:mannose-1-phosphate guanylyltransferase/mannose-6-phosphate isomerase [Ancylobacter sp. Lp-2]|uniref:mannose-1-phosphate guanylyltransferase/mannose-6-phosphate isomerase n=1 Tax=Ancylobacter sp. Lp-2 TaxID=2881339 RepID=UPI002101D739|nr:mannose-1-phosphate guanylyltransferase/mannose-6-phosphate isomerase [Ancylobacter sp. Lp-2]
MNSINQSVFAEGSRVEADRFGGSDKIVPVIMCGGAGTRLWPVSRDTMPKQFVPLLGAKSTFQGAMELVSDADAFSEAIVITNVEYRFIVAEQLAAIGVKAQIILEPCRRDSSAAVAVATQFVLSHIGPRVVGVFAADHVVQDGGAFLEACRHGAAVAAEGRIVTIGISPTRPETGFGYIRAGEEVGTKAYRVAEFVEKPDSERAAQYVAENYLWNSGNFIFDAATMRSELRTFEPTIWDVAITSLEKATSDLGCLLLDPQSFEKAKKVSIDYSVMERTHKAAVVAGGFGWSDVGGWPAVWEMSPKDESGNAITGRGYVLDGGRNFVAANEAVVAVIGLDDVAVIATRDAVLVTAKSRAGKVKEMVSLLAAKGDTEATTHQEVHRPWGKYLSIDRGVRHQVKRITVKPGGVLSLQKHHHRAEHWVVVRGTAEVTRNDEIVLVHENESIYLPIGCVHRMSNPGKIPLEIIEVQVGSYLGEDDIVRLQDAYRRV